MNQSEPMPVGPAAAALSKVYILGFTGHRQVKNPEAISAAFARELERIKSTGIEMMALSSVAAGADTLFARSVLRAGIKWVALLPMPPEIFQNDFSAAAWAEVEKLLAQASQVRILPGNERPQAYVDCGKTTVDDSDYLFAVWDGNAAKGPGGTAEIVGYARMLGREITCFRETDAGVDRLAPADLSPLAFTPQEILARMGEAPPLPDPPARLLESFAVSNDIANRIAPNFRRDIMRMMGLLLGATLLSGLTLALNAEHLHLPGLVPALLSATKVAVVASALWIGITVKRSHMRDLWVTERLKAEYCRSVLATWYCAKPVDPIPVHAVPELRDLSQAVRFLRTGTRVDPTVGLDQFRADYAAGRVMHQLKYFEGEVKKAVALAKPLRTRYWVYTISAFASAGLALVVHAFHDRLTAGLSLFPRWSGVLYHLLLDIAPLVLPAMASFTLAKMAIQDVERRLGRYHELQKSMHMALIDLSFCRSWTSLQKTVEQTEKILLNEVLEWYSVSKYSKN
jgi:hypothetical protein